MEYNCALSLFLFLHQSYSTFSVKGHVLIHDLVGKLLLFHILAARPSGNRDMWFIPAT